MNEAQKTVPAAEPPPFSEQVKAFTDEQLEAERAALVADVNTHGQAQAAARAALDQVYTEQHKRRIKPPRKAEAHATEQCLCPACRVFRL